MKTEKYVYYGGDYYRAEKIERSIVQTKDVLKKYS